MTDNVLGLTSRLTVTASNAGSRTDLAVRRIATPIPGAGFQRTEFVLGPNTENAGAAEARRDFVVATYVMIHTEAPLRLELTGADNVTANLVVSDIFLATAPIKRLRLINLDQVHSVRVSAIVA